MSTASTLMGTFGTTDYLLPLVLEDLSDEDSRRRCRGDEGPSIAWAVGHLLSCRLHVMQVLGSPRGENPFAERFQTAGATDGEGYPTIAQLIDHWGAVAGELRALVESTSEEEFDRTVAGLTGQQSLRDQVAFFAWHEGYHVGGIGTQLKAMGYLGPAEKVMARREGDSRHVG